MTSRDDYKSTVMDLIHSIVGQANILTIPRVLIDFMGDLEGALLLSQILYWQGRSNQPGGWFYKTYVDWEEEVCLSKYKVSKAVSRMKAMGFLETKVKKASGSPTVHYLLDRQEFERQLIKKLRQKDVGPEMESQKLDNGKLNNSTNDSEEILQSLTETATGIIDIYQPAQNDARVSAEPEPVTDAPPQKRKKRKKGKQELPFPEDHKAIVRVLADATGIDLAVCPVAERGRLNKASGIFRRGGYRIGDVRSIVRHWRERDWRGKKGNIPTLEQLRNHAGVWRKEHRAKERERKEVEARHAEAWAKHDAMERRRAAQNAKVQQEIADWKAQQQQQRKEIAHHGPT